MSTEQNGPAVCQAGRLTRIFYSGVKNVGDNVVLGLGLSRQRQVA